MTAKSPSRPLRSVLLIRSKLIDTSAMLTWPSCSSIHQPLPRRMWMVGSDPRYHMLRTHTHTHTHIHTHTHTHTQLLAFGANVVILSDACKSKPCVVHITVHNVSSGLELNCAFRVKCIFVAIHMYVCRVLHFNIITWCAF